MLTDRSRLLALWVPASVSSSSSPSLHPRTPALACSRSPTAAKRRHGGGPRLEIVLRGLKRLQLRVARPWYSVHRSRHPTQSQRQGGMIHTTLHVPSLSLPSSFLSFLPSFLSYIPTLSFSHILPYIIQTWLSTLPSSESVLSALNSFARSLPPSPKRLPSSPSPTRAPCSSPTRPSAMTRGRTAS